MLKTTSPFLRAFVAAALIGGLALASPSFAASTGSSSDMEMQSSASAGGKAPSAQDMAQRVETRIQTLHDKLKITSDQESEWNDVAQAMRDNESNIRQVIDARHQNATTMSAVDDLQSYQKIAQAHADGLNKVISSFSTLYSDMSPAQQKNADEVFGRYEGHRGATKASAKKKGSMSSGGGSSTDSMDSE